MSSYSRNWPFLKTWAGEVMAITQHDPPLDIGQLIPFGDLCFTFSLDLSNHSIQLLDTVMPKPAMWGALLWIAFISPNTESWSANVIFPQAFSPGKGHRHVPREWAFFTIWGKTIIIPSTASGCAPASLLHAHRTDLSPLSLGSSTAIPTSASPGKNAPPHTKWGTNYQKSYCRGI